MSTMGPLCPEQLTQEETLEEVCVGPLSDINDEPTIELTYARQSDFCRLEIASVTRRFCTSRRVTKGLLPRRAECRFRSVMRSLGGAADQHRLTIFASGPKFL
jgi:hypothetical protein